MFQFCEIQTILPETAAEQNIVFSFHIGFQNMNIWIFSQQYTLSQLLLIICIFSHHAYFLNQKYLDSKNAETRFILRHFILNETADSQETQSYYHFSNKFSSSCISGCLLFSFAGASITVARVLFCTEHSLCLLATQWHNQHWTCSPAPDTLQKRPLLPTNFCGSAQSQGFSSSTGILFHSLLAHTAVIWVLLQCDLTFIPSSSQAVKENTIWNASEFTGLTLCQSLPPSLWCLVWKENFSETASCFEAKCKKRNLSNLSICFYSSPVLLQQTVQPSESFTYHHTHNSSRPPVPHLSSLQYISAAQFVIVVVVHWN